MLGSILRQAGKLREALSVHEEALASARALGARAAVLEHQFGIALVHWALSSSARRAASGSASPAERAERLAAARSEEIGRAHV